MFPFLRKALFHFASILWHEGANSHLHNHLRVNIRVSNHLQRFWDWYIKKNDLAKLLEVDLAGVVLVVEENCLVHNLKNARQVKLLRDKARPSFFAVVAFFQFSYKKSAYTKDMVNWSPAAAGCLSSCFPPSSSTPGQDKDKACCKGKCLFVFVDFIASTWKSSPLEMYPSLSIS